MRRRVVFAGGGTGGHLMPALALAEEMVRLDSTIEPFFVGSHGGVEAGVLPHRPWRHVLLPFEPLWRRQWWKNARLPWTLYRTLRGVRAVLRREDPDLVVGTGGYVSAPVVWAATLRGIPAVIQEQNAYPGLATRWLARRARQVHLGFPEAEKYIKPGPDTRVFVSGNPIQPPPAQRLGRQEAKRRLGFAPDEPLVLVMGGSQGALPINRAVKEALEGGRWPPGVQLLWQTGAATHDRFADQSHPGSVVVEAFIDPIERAYSAADLVLSRSGAMTVAEVMAWGLPAVLIPLPTAAAGHQLRNARALAAAGAALLLEQAGLTGATLGARVGELLAEPARLADVGRAAQARSLPRAVSEIASRALEIASKI